jgi:hypothetical protein
MIKASTAKAKANVKAMTAFQPQMQTVKHAAVDNKANTETDSAKDKDLRNEKWEQLVLSSSRTFPFLCRYYFQRA